MASISLGESGGEVLAGESVASRKPVRNQAIETLRILAAFGIVAYHSNAPFHNLAYAGLIVFLILSPMVDVRYNWGRPRSVGQLARTLLAPWAFWMAIYGMKDVAQHSPVLGAGNPVAGILMGTSQHLWFLPFIFVALLLTNKAKVWCPPLALFWLCAIGAGLLLATVSIWRPASLGWPLPLPQWIHALAPVMIGIVLGLTPRVGKAAWLAVVPLAGALVVAIAADLPGVSDTYALGIGLTVLAATSPAAWWPRRWVVQPVAECMMGVYLTHILFLKIFSTISGSGNYLTVILTFVFASLFVWMARTMFPKSKLVL
ncbi:acyltransferase family protein [Novosphingobium nitrogenifigens]|uniref:acyltransferase family protein n=1 Tax=Novosphingobium nitrogenifigens TaxID=378548 RepID=UPI0012F4A636|nr:acyltransferase family protein [Novosphingobium nitrogenifigens]